MYPGMAFVVLIMKCGFLQLRCVMSGLLIECAPTPESGEKSP